jgi:formate hydrogenlyase subunit 3/multisubunit Na+/H+ antiporter MnhD subunit
MFLAAGNIAHAAGHDRIADLDGITQALPLSVAAFALAGISLIGLPPSGGFIAKWMLLQAAIGSGEWGWTALILAGSLLAAAYVMRVLWHAFTQVEVARPLHRVPRTMEWSALALSLLAVLLGLMAARPVELLRSGAPVSIHAPGQT